MTVMKSKRIEKGCVYVIAASNGYVKIGSTGGNPYERFGTVACHSPLPVTLDYVVDCAFPVDVEEAVHRLLEPYRRHREWFEIAPLDAIRAIKTTLAARGYLTAGVQDRVRGKVGTPFVYQAGLREMAMPV